MSTISIVKSANEIGGAVVGSAAAMGAAWATAAIPIVGPGVAAVTIAIMLILGRKGPKQKTATTAIVNDIEPQLAANVQAYLDGPRTAESQAQAIENFKAGWQAVLDNCGDPSMGKPGQNCIAERQEGARPQWDGCRDEPGGCKNWFELYLYPIQQNPPVAKTTVSGEASANDWAALYRDPAAATASFPSIDRRVLLGLGAALLFFGALKAVQS